MKEFAIHLPALVALLLQSNFANAYPNHAESLPKDTPRNIDEINAIIESQNNDILGCPHIADCHSDLKKSDIKIASQWVYIDPPGRWYLLL
ncbi:MAG: hypothetical protein P8171_17300 [Candidatus Thiodiazotropha sp.]